MIYCFIVDCGPEMRRKEVNSSLSVLDLAKYSVEMFISGLRKSHAIGPDTALMLVSSGNGTANYH
jgi:hypothetical protein